MRRGIDRLSRALGLRARIVGAVLVTTVLTLAVAAAGLLGPLEHELRNAALQTLVADLRHGGAVASFRRLDLRYVLDTSPSDRSSGVGPRNPGAGHSQRAALQREEQSLGSTLGATVTLFGQFDLAGNAQRVPTLEPPTDEESLTSDIGSAFRRRGWVQSFGTLEGTEFARVAVPVKIGGQDYVLAVRRPVTEVAAAVRVVRKAFLDAALAGFVLTFLLGIPLSARLVRRLRRLRETAVRVTQQGPAVAVPEDRARDEVGDLARALALMQRRLRSQEEARRSFVATASHELRTPLTSLEGMLELLDDELHDNDPDLRDARELVARARAQSHRLGHLAADLLDLSRIDADVELRSEPIELAELSRAVLAEFERGSEERDVLCALHESSSPVWALGDPGSVARILRILVDNALRVSPRGSRVVVELAGGAEARLSVRDEGPGVEPAERELIFERFHRGRQRGGEAGFGLGLAIGRELAQRMRGRLELDQTEGEGARFVLRLPLAVAPEHEATPVG